jgi:hypothetical protein
VDFLNTTLVVTPSAETLGRVHTLKVLPETDPASSLTATLVYTANSSTTLHSVSSTIPTELTVADPVSPLKTLPH